MPERIIGGNKNVKTMSWDDCPDMAWSELNRSTTPVLPGAVKNGTESKLSFYFKLVQRHSAQIAQRYRQDRIGACNDAPQDSDIM
jgi:hypothetical protein